MRGLSVAACLTFAATPAPGQTIVSDSSTATSVNFVGGVYAITGGTQVGQNLLHSFTAFSIGNGNSATFSGPGGISNIISRVTGGQPTTIDGLLESTIPNANFWFINPAGVTFGPNATLNVPGSLHVGTADHVVFTDGAIFSATDPSASSFTAALPKAFGFVGGGIGRIAVNGATLRLDNGKSLSFVADDVRIDGAVLDLAGSAIQPGGAVTLAGIGAAGTVDPSAPAGAPAGGRVEIRNGRILVAGNGGGSLDVRAANLLITDGTFIDARNSGAADAGGGIALHGANGLNIDGDTQMSAQARGTGLGGTVSLSGDDIFLSGGARVFGGTQMGAAGAGGGISIDAGGLLDVRGGATLDTFTRGAGRGGDLVIRVDRFVLDGAGSFALASAGSTGSGNSGAIDISVGSRLEIRDGGAIQAATRASGNAGDIAVSATDIVIDGSNAVPGSLTGIAVPLDLADGTGRAGTLDIRASGTLTITNGLINSITRGGGGAGTARVAAGTLTLSGVNSGIAVSTGGTGNAGDIVVDVAGTLSVTDRADIGSSTFSSGDAGRVTVVARDIVLESSGTISSVSFNPSVGPPATGRGGTLDVTARNNLSISGRAPKGTVSSGITATTRTTGAGGTVIVNAANVALSDSGEIVTRSESAANGAGAAGDIRIAADATLRIDNGSISTAAVAADGGGINIQVGNVLSVVGGGITTNVAGKPGNGGDIRINVGQLLNLDNASIETSVGQGNGNGGNIFIDPQFVVLRNGRIVANAFGGNGGNIGITAGNFLADPNSLVAASSQLGIAGTIVIDAPDEDVSGSLVVLPANFLDAASQLAQQCAARRGRTRASFVGTGRGGLPVQPGGAIPAFYRAGGQGRGSAEFRGEIEAFSGSVAAATSVLGPCSG